MSDTAQSGYFGATGFFILYSNRLRNTVFVELVTCTYEHVQQFMFFCGVGSLNVGMRGEKIHAVANNAVLGE